MKLFGFSKVLFIAVIAVVLLCAGLFALYMCIYRRKLNAALTGTGGRHTSRWTAPPWVCLIVLILFGGSIITAFSLMNSMFGGSTEGGLSFTAGADSGHKIGNIDFGEIKVTYWSPADVAETLLGDYAPGDDIKGYTKSEHTDGDIRFVCYTNSSCGIMPSLLIYTEYTGTGDFAYSDSTLHVDNREWSDEEFDRGGWICEEKGMWFKVDNFVNSGSMTFKQTVTTSDGEDATGSVFIDIKKAFGGPGYSESTAE